MIKPKHPGGRPTNYRPEHCIQMIEAMATGLSAEAAAASIGISNRALHEWQQRHEEFRSAIQEGRQLALLWWERRAQAMAEGGPGSAQIVSLGLRNRSRAASGWVDTHKMEHSGGDGGPILTQQAVTIDPSSLTPQERVVLRKALMAMQAAGGRQQVG
jgi:hypothetical protein